MCVHNCLCQSTNRSLIYIYIYIYTHICIELYICVYIMHTKKEGKKQGRFVFSAFLDCNYMHRHELCWWHKQPLTSWRESTCWIHLFILFYFSLCIHLSTLYVSLCYGQYASLKPCVQNIIHWPCHEQIKMEREWVKELLINKYINEQVYKYMNWTLFSFSCMIRKKGILSFFFKFFVFKVSAE